MINLDLMVKSFYKEQKQQIINNKNVIKLLTREYQSEYLTVQYYMNVLRK